MNSQYGIYADFQFNRVSIRDKFKGVKLLERSQHLCVKEQRERKKKGKKIVVCQIG